MLSTWLRHELAKRIRFDALCARMLGLLAQFVIIRDPSLSDSPCCRAPRYEFDRDNVSLRSQVYSLEHLLGGTAQLRTSQPMLPCRTTAHLLARVSSRTDSKLRWNDGVSYAVGNVSPIPLRVIIRICPCAEIGCDMPSGNCTELRASGRRLFASE